MLNQFSSEDIEQMGIFGFTANSNIMAPSVFGYNRSTMTSSNMVDMYSNIPQQDPEMKLSHMGFNIPQLIPLQTTANIWAYGELKSDGMTNNNIMRRPSMKDHEDEKYQEQKGVSSTTMKIMKKKIKAGAVKKKVREPRFSFKTMSDVDVLDDGYKWRKYGQKVVKHTHHPRSYYRCTQDNCRVKKRVERLAEDPRMVITTYEGRHMHSPTPNDNNDHTVEF